jgi:hypothetical protein
MIDFDIESFVRKYMTKRPESLLAADENEIFSRLLLHVAGWIVYNVRRWRVIC